MGKRLLSSDYSNFIANWLKSGDEKTLRINLINFCEGNFHKNENIIERTSILLDGFEEDTKIKLCRSLLSDLTKCIIEWKFQHEVEVNMEIEELTIIRLHINIIDFKNLSLSELEERKELMKFLLNFHL